MKKILSLLLMLFSLQHLSLAQDPHLVDSLTNELKTHKQDTTGADILYALSKAYWGPDPDKAMDYARQTLALSEQINYKKGQGNAYNSMGFIAGQKGDYIPALDLHKKALKIRLEIDDKNGIGASYGNMGLIYHSQGNYPEALKNQFACLKIKEEIGDKRGMGNAYNNMGIVYADQGNEKEALKNFFSGLKIMEDLGNKPVAAFVSSNIGNIYINQGNYEAALKNFFAAFKAQEEMGDKIGLAGSYTKIGKTYFAQGNYAEALKCQVASLKIYEEVGNKDGIAMASSNIGSIYTTQAKYQDASEYLNKALSAAKEIGSLEKMKTSYGGLATLDSAKGNYKQSLEHYKLFISTRDSMVNDENTKKTVQLQMQYEFDKKETATKAEQEKKDAIALKELQKQKLMRNGFIGGFTVVLLFAGTFFTQRNKIKKGKKRSDELLLNILPGEVAEELKAKGSADAKQFDEVTVMFTDFKGFTQISEKLSPAELVAEIHTCFKAFDNIITKHNIEKIKTIGDSYMCAGGLPVANKTNAKDIVNAAMEIQQLMNAPPNPPEGEESQRGGQVSPPIGGRFRGAVRIGVHTGPVVAGIVGVKKFAYDIWGDTVNIASRMESSGEAGKVNISGSTYELVKDKFRCEHRGKIEAKNKGEIDMYFVESII